MPSLPWIALAPEGRAFAEVVDIDADRDLDIVLGNFCMFYPEGLTTEASLTILENTLSDAPSSSP